MVRHSARSAAHEALAQPALAPQPTAASSSAASARVVAKPRPAPGSTTPASAIAPASGLAASGIPITALTAYRNAAAHAPAGCGIAWPLLAGIGRVESDHGRFAGAVLHSDGLSTPPVVGIPLDGHGTALIRDTDGGRLDGDAVYDRAVGPMQFIPSTWAGWGVDMNADGRADPFNIFDAAGAAADYLCAAGGDLTTASGQVRAILSYNYSYDYVRAVMGVEQIYAAGVGVTVPVLPASLPTHGRPSGHPALPPVDPGAPRGATINAAVTRESSSAPRSSTSSVTGGASSSTAAGSTAAGDPTSSSVAASPTDSATPTETATSSSTSSSSGTSTSPSDSPSPTESTPPADPTTSDSTSSATDSTTPSDAPSSSSTP
jgi:membrane-bound lytic murein transglycosylase B